MTLTFYVNSNQLPRGTRGRGGEHGNQVNLVRAAVWQTVDGVDRPKTEGVVAGAMSGFWNWLGFIAPVTIGMVLWEGKPWKLWILTNGYQLVNLVVGGVILGVWRYWFMV